MKNTVPVDLNDEIASVSLINGTDGSISGVLSKRKPK